jgi:parvulin-like peptidyl-prolyl isomerase
MPFPLRSPLALLALVSLVFLISLVACKGSDKAETGPADTPATQEEGTPSEAGASAPAETSAATAEGAGGIAARPDRPKKPPVIDSDTDILIVINGQPISRRVYDTQLAMLRPTDQFDNFSEEEEELPEPDNEIKAEILSILIQVELATIEAYSLGFAPTSQEREELFKAAARNFGGEEELSKALSEFGGSIDEYHNQVERTEALKNWRDAAFLSIAKISEEEIKEFYDSHLEDAKHDDQVRAIHIMFPIPLATGTPEENEENKQKVRVRAEEALTLARSGRDFQELMRIYMDENTRNATADGRLGWISQGQSFPELEEVIFKMEPGEISDIIETSFSLHIAKVLEKRAAGTLSYEELKPEIKELLFENKIDSLLQERLKEMVKNAKIEIKDPILNKLWTAYFENDFSLPEELSGQASLSDPPAAGGSDSPATPEQSPASDTPGSDSPADTPQTTDEVSQGTQGGSPEGSSEMEYDSFFGTY